MSDRQPPDYRVFADELFDVRAKWYEFGIQLGVDYKTLNAIEKENRDIAGAFHRMLQTWYDGTQTPSWVAVIRALQSRTVHEMVLASNLKARYRVVPSEAAAQTQLAIEHVSFVRPPPAGMALPVVACPVDKAVQRDIDRLNQAFQDIYMDVYAYLDENTPNLKEFAIFVALPFPSRKTKSSKQMSKVDLDAVMRPGTEFYQMYGIVGQYTTWYNYELLDNIIQRYGDPLLKGKMDVYRSALAEFESRTSAEKLKNVILGQPLADSVTIIAKLRHYHCNQFMASDVRMIKDQYAAGAGVSSDKLRVNVISESSVTIIFLVPISLAPFFIVSSRAITPLLTSGQPIPDDMNERCVHYMSEEEVFRLMGRTVAPSSPVRTISESSISSSTTQSSHLVLRSICSGESIASSDVEEIYPPIDPSRIQIFHDKVLMNGDNAVVCKAKFLNLPCAAKYIHQKLVETSTWQLEDFKKGCKILQGCRHPTIVGFLGIHHDNRLGRPILLMELMDQSLKDLLDLRKVDLPLHMQLDICSDVAQALDYLHARNIIHSNLTASNVLVKEGRAKVCGAMSLQLNMPDAELSLCPGAPESMPRRSFSLADYDEAIDCFSFGVLAIHLATKEIPRPSIHTRELNEVKRYATSLQKVKEKNHILYSLIVQCLNDVDTERPSASKLCREFSDLTRSSSYRTSQSAGHIATDLVSMQLDYEREKLQEKTEEILQLKKVLLDYDCKLKSKTREFEAVKASEGSLKNTLAMVEGQKQELEHKITVASEELQEIKRQSREATEQKELKLQKQKADIMEKINELQKQRDDFKKERDTYRDRLEQSAQNYAR